MTTTTALVDCITARLEAGDYEGLAELYRPDALLDANVPQWRYQLQGPAAILQLFGEGEMTLAGWRLASSRATTTADGVVVEAEVHFDHEGDERLWRNVHIVHTDGESITDHVIYYTGIWDAAAITRQRVEAPMVRPR